MERSFKNKIMERSFKNKIMERSFETSGQLIQNLMAQKYWIVRLSMFNPIIVKIVILESFTNSMHHVLK